MKPTLVVLAAGIGSRYGSLKQMDRVGSSGRSDGSRTKSSGPACAEPTSLEQLRFRRVFPWARGASSGLTPDRYPLFAADPDVAAHQAITRLLEDCSEACQRLPEPKARRKVAAALGRIRPAQGRAALAVAAVVRWIWIYENAFVPRGPGSSQSRPEFLTYGRALRAAVRELLAGAVAFDAGQLGRIVDALARARELNDRWELPWKALLRRLDVSARGPELRASLCKLHDRLAWEMRRFHEGEHERVDGVSMGEVLAGLKALTAPPVRLKPGR